LQIKRSELSTNETKRTEEAPCVILPLSVSEPLILGDCNIFLSDPLYVELLLLLGLSAKTGFQVRLLSNALERKNWGWLLLDKDLRELAHRFNSHLLQNCDASLLFVEGSLCRLRLGQENIFFSPDLFRAELQEERLTLIRSSRDYKGLFHLDAESRSVELSVPNREHLQNILNGNSDRVTWDNLRKLRTKSNQRLDDFAKQCGLFQLYEPLNDTTSKEMQEFRFSIHVE
jgi:hypothetical protein